jgi:hypothetical protein
MITSENFREIASPALIELLGTLEPRDATPYSCEVVSGSVAIAVSYDASRSRELTLSLRQQGQVDPPFEIADVLRVTPCPKEEYQRFSLMQTGEPDVLGKLLRAACDSLMRYGGEFLAGSPVAFERARSDRSRRAAVYTEGINDAPILHAADEAWHRGMSAVVKRLRPLEARLGDRDKRRLVYALRSVEGDGEPS